MNFNLFFQNVIFLLNFLVYDLISTYYFQLLKRITTPQTLKYQYYSLIFNFRYFSSLNFLQKICLQFIKNLFLGLPSFLKLTLRLRNNRYILKTTRLSDPFIKNKTFWVVTVNNERFLKFCEHQNLFRSNYNFTLKLLSSISYHLESNILIEV